MKEGYRLLGDFIQPVDERNRDLKVDYLLGVSISKQFIPSIANIVGTDLSSYKIVHTGQFAYGPVTSRNGEKISIALLRDKDCIISSSYTVFEVVNKNALDPEYLMLWFSRPEFDRYARYMSHGSVREIFDWDELCKVELPVPSIDKQRSIVKAYQTITERIELKRRINDNLEQQARALYQRMFIDNPVSGGYMGTLSDIADITMGQSPNGSSYNEDGNGAVFFQGRAEFGFRFPSARLYTTEPKRMACANDTLMSVRAPVGDLNVAYTDCCIGRGLAAIHSKSNQQSFVLYTMFSLHKQLDVFNGEGTVFGSINRTALTELPIFIPSDREIVKFEAIVAPIDAAIRNNYEEICRLEKIRDALLPKLMSGELDVSAVEL